MHVQEMPAQRARRRTVKQRPQCSQQRASLTLVMKPCTQELSEIWAFWESACTGCPEIHLELSSKDLVFENRVINLDVGCSQNYGPFWFALYRMGPPNLGTTHVDAAVFTKGASACGASRPCQDIPPWIYCDTMKSPNAHNKNTYRKLQEAQGKFWGPFSRNQQV